MEKITLTLDEFYVLNSELQGVSNQETGEVLVSGLLAEKVKLTTKYWLQDLSVRVATESTAIDKLREELIKKHGNADDRGNVSIPMYEDVPGSDEKIVSQSFRSFQEEFSLLLAEKKELEYHQFKLEDFDNVETSTNYNIFFKLISNI